MIDFKFSTPIAVEKYTYEMNKAIENENDTEVINLLCAAFREFDPVLVENGKVKHPCIKGMTGGFIYLENRKYKFGVAEFDDFGKQFTITKDGKSCWHSEYARTKEESLPEGATVH
jgi:hypothetical protein